VTFFASERILANNYNKRLVKLKHFVEIVFRVLRGYH